MTTHELVVLVRIVVRRATNSSSCKDEPVLFRYTVVAVGSSAGCGTEGNVARMEPIDRWGHVLRYGVGTLSPTLARASRRTSRSC